MPRAFFAYLPVAVTLSVAVSMMLIVPLPSLATYAVAAFDGATTSKRAIGKM